MNERAAILVASIVIVLSAVTVFGMAALDPGTLDHLRERLQDDPGYQENMPDRNEFIHKHAHLYFLVDGERKALDDAYIERDRGVHFHHDDGIIHIEGDDATLAETMAVHEITVNATCVEYGLDNETYCEQEDTELRLIVNGDEYAHDEWMNYTIKQGDNIILFYGDEDDEVPDEFYEPLPDGYAPGYDRL